MERRGVAAYTVPFPGIFLCPCGRLEAAFRAIVIISLPMPANALITLSCLYDYDIKKAGE